MEAEKKPVSPLYRAFMRGVSIAAPAFITIAVFAWVWGVLKDNVVTIIIASLDAPKVFNAREVSDAEVQRLGEMFEASREHVADGGAAFPPDLVEPDKSKPMRAGKYSYKLLRPPVPTEEPEEFQGLSPLGKRRSPIQLLLDEWQLKREYEPGNGRVIAYNWAEYVLASVIGLVLVVFLGFAARNFAGRRLVELFNLLVSKAPVLKLVYPHVKQLVDFFFQEKKLIEFDKVVACEWPRKGMWSLGFVTGSGLKCLQELTGRRLVTVYFPSSPTPMTGYTHYVPAEDVLSLAISVEDAMKIVISGGVLAPLEEMVKPHSGAQLALARGVDEQVRERHSKIAEQTAQMLKSEIQAGLTLNPPEEKKD